MHTAVMLQEAITALNIKPDGCYIDATFGRGGHSTAILSLLSQEGRLFAIDKDVAAYNAGLELANQDARFKIFHESYQNIYDLAKIAGILGKVDGVLFDLGVSSPQLEAAERGFSFMQDGPLDMRMDERQQITAAQLLASATEQELSDILWRYGEERFARKIAKRIVLMRKSQAITTTYKLVELIKSAIPKFERAKHPATRTFQALRIAVNNELSELEMALARICDILAQGSRLVVISFHSLEDRIVKNFIRTKVKELSMQRIDKYFKPNIAEINSNKRARSAIMRVAVMERSNLETARRSVVL